MMLLGDALQKERRTVVTIDCRERRSLRASDTFDDEQPDHIQERISSKYSQRSVELEAVPLFVFLSRYSLQRGGTPKPLLDSRRFRLTDYIGKPLYAA